MMTIQSQVGMRILSFAKGAPDSTRSRPCSQLSLAPTTLVSAEETDYPPEGGASSRTGSRGKMARVTEADDLPVVEVVVLAKHCDASGGRPETDIAE